MRLYIILILHVIIEQDETEVRIKQQYRGRAIFFWLLNISPDKITDNLEWKMSFMRPERRKRKKEKGEGQEMENWKKVKNLKDLESTIFEEKNICSEECECECVITAG